MKPSILFFLAAFLTGTLKAESAMFDPPLSPRIANYKIDVRLDPAASKLEGVEILRWRNTSNDTISELRFHMYMNAFKNDRSTFMHESGGSHRASRIDREKGWGWIEITGINRNGGADLTGNMTYIQPDDDNIYDQTVLQVQLDQVLMPNDTIEVLIRFTTKLPIVFARTGYHGDFFMAGQWFPKIGVWESGNGWNCHQLHENSEFFADFGVYSVSITLPDEFITGATGILQEEQSNGDGTKTVKYYCEDVHDFAWTADTDYIIFTDQWKHVNIRYLCQPMHEHNVDRYLASAKFALSFMEDWVGPYPYPVLTIVDPQYGARGAGGMEYPTLITAGNHWLLPAGIRFSEEVTVHEFAHNYFYGMLASNEFEEAWLDEGMTTYSHVKIMEAYFPGALGSALDLWGMQIDEPEYIWVLYARNPKQDKIYKRSWEYERGGYGTFSYYKPALMLLTLENYLGTDRMRRVWHTYYDRYRFKHPKTQDFIGVVNEAAGEDMRWFLEPVIYGTEVLDYAIDRIRVEPLRSRFGGIFGNPMEAAAEDSTVSPDTTAAEQEKKYESTVVVSREGEIIFPVEIRIEFDDGEMLTEHWDGNDRYKVYTYQKSARILSAQVDPEHKIWLDVNFLNNGKKRNDDKPAAAKYTWRWLFWMQNFLQNLLFFS